MQTGTHLASFVLKKKINQIFRYVFLTNNCWAKKMPAGDSMSRTQEHSAEWGAAGQCVPALDRNCRASEAVIAAQIRKPRYKVGNVFDKVTQQAQHHS